MSDASFSSQFKQLTGHPPFGWQARLFEEYFLAGRVPALVDVPTGLGKTAIIALWFIAIRAGAKLPRRLVYVVDRRAVVDQATRFVDGLRANLPADDYLPVSTLRGQHADNRDWLKDPSSPAIIVGTVDMIGSRLLFEGYGVSRRMRPYQAGLLGADSLLVLDEAHLCPPFEILLDTISREPDLQGSVAAAQSMISPLQLMSLTATGKRSRKPAFQLQEKDLEVTLQPEVYRRFAAQKQLTTCTLRERANLVEEISARAWKVGTQHGPARVLVFCNHRTDAIKVKNHLDRQLRKEKLPQLTELLVGARRVRERAALQDWLQQNGFLDSSDAPESPTFLVATSAGEVGVDLDADHLICDLVPWERMVQRFGRVNRRGGSQRRALIEVVVPPIKKSTDESEVAMRRAILSLLDKLPQPNSEEHRDASPAGIDQLKRNAESDPSLQELLATATTRDPLRPTLTRAVVDSWSLTSLEEHPGRPKIDPWLRGWIKDDPQTTVAWRRNLPWRLNEREPLASEVEHHFSVAPIHLEEQLESPTWQVIETLLQRTSRFVKQLQVEEPNASIDSRPGAIALSPTGKFVGAWSIASLHWLSKQKPAIRRQELSEWVGCTIVVAADLGGLNEDGMLDPASGPPSTLDSFKDGRWNEQVRQRIGYCPVGPTDPPLESTRWKVASSLSLLPPESTEDDHIRPLRIFVYRGKGTAGIGDLAIATTVQTLSEHLEWTALEAQRIADELDLPVKYREMLVAAAVGHDIGKNRVLWQTAMNAPRTGEPYAKTLGGGDGRKLNGYRHEFGSLRDINLSDSLSHLDPDLCELAKHLIVSHHGFARPTIAPFDPDSSPSERSDLARDIANRFARLQQAWGPWGLAWWESLLRAADFRASERLDKGEV